MKALKWMAGIFGVFVLLAIVGAMFAPDRPERPPAERTAEQAEARAALERMANAEKQAEIRKQNEPRLELLAFSWSERSSYAIVEGMVKNSSDEPMRGIQAMAIFDDAEGTFITSGSSYIEYQPILAGQSSPFKVMERWNPAMKTARVEFKASGAEIPTKQSWK